LPGIFEEGNQRKSTLSTAQPPVARWHATIGVPTIAVAILDHIIHNAHRIELTGDSMCKRKSATPLTQLKINKSSIYDSHQTGENLRHQTVRELVKQMSAI